MFLSDVDIKKYLEEEKITISDFDIKRLQPVSYDIRLGNKFEITQDHLLSAVDPVNKVLPSSTEIVIGDNESFVLHPGKTILATSREFFGSKEFLIHLSGKSSLARLGLVVHNTAGIVNPGHFLHITFELFNAGNIPIILRPGMEIAQILFAMISTPPEQSYEETGTFHGDNWSKNFNTKA